MADSDSNVLDFLERLALDMPSMRDASDALGRMYGECMRQPQALRREVERYEYGDLHGRPALVADIRRELALILDALDREPQPVVSDDAPTGASVSPTPSGGGLVWRLAVLRAYDNLSAAA